MAKKIIAPHGKIVQGDYNGMNIYVWKENVSLKIVAGMVKTGFLAPVYTELALIDHSNLKNYKLHKLISASGPSSVCQSAVGEARLPPELLTSATLRSSATTIYNVGLSFKDGRQCVAELGSFAYKTLTAIYFQSQYD